LHRSSLQRRDALVDRARGRLAIARCLLRLGRASVAWVDLRAAASMSTDEALQLDVAALWIEAKRPVEALECLASLQKAHPSARGFALQARGLGMAGRIPEAERAAAVAVELEPGNVRHQELLERLQSLLPDKSSR